MSLNALISRFDKKVNEKLDRICGMIMGMIYAHAKSKKDFNPQKDHIIEQVLLLLEECKQSKLTDIEGFGANPSFLKGTFVTDDIEPAFKEFLTNGGNPSDYDLVGPDYYVVLPFCALFKIPINTAIIKVQLSHTSPVALFNSMIIATLLNLLIKCDLFDVDMDHHIQQLIQTIIPAYSKYLVDMQKVNLTKDGLSDTAKMRIETKIRRIEAATKNILEILGSAELGGHSDIEHFLSFVIFHNKEKEPIDLEEVKLSYPSSILFGAVIGVVIGYKNLPTEWKKSIPAVLHNHLELQIVDMFNS
jgi:hypothetical protein